MKSSQYAWFAIVGFNLFSLVVLPLYFYDARVRLRSGIWKTPTEEIFHITASDDAKKFQQIIDRIEQWYKAHPCLTYICDIPFPRLKLHEAYSIIDTFRLMGSNWFAPGYPYHYWRAVEYQGNYSTLHVDIPYFDFVFNSFVISSVGSAAIALGWIKFGQSKDKHSIVQT